MILIDTCIFLSILYGESGSERFVKFLTGRKDCVISVITLSEILSSAYKKFEEEAVKAKILVEKFTGEENIVPVTKEIAEMAGKLKAKYSGGFSLADAIILSTAIITECEAIATTDPEFEKIKEIKIIKP